MVNILAADKLMHSPKLYATFLLWLLSELFEHLPEVGDPDKPKLVFFFDEAHLLFNDAPKALLEKIEQVVRLIRSKGVGVYFVTQNPLDIPDTVLGQLGNRVQHALRAFTPRDQKAVKAAAADLARQSRSSTSRRRSPSSAWARRWCRCSTRKGRPSIVERALDRAAGTQDRPDHARRAPGGHRRTRSISGHYEKAVDRESAYEKLERPGAGAPGRARRRAPPTGKAPTAARRRSWTRSAAC